MRRSFCFGTGLLLLLALVRPAAADLIDGFNSDDATTDTGGKPVTCAPASGKCGTVDISQVNATTVLVTITLTNTSGGFSNFVGNNAVFGFNIIGAPAINISNISNTTLFSVGSTSVTEDSMYGKFDYTINCDTCSSSTHPATLSFDVSLTGGGNLAVNSFNAKSTDGTTGAFFFAADNGNGNRQGIIASIASPEAPTYAFLASPLIALFFLRRRRFRTATALMGR